MRLRFGNTITVLALIGLSPLMFVPTGASADSISQTNPDPAAEPAPSDPAPSDQQSRDDAEGRSDGEGNRRAKNIILFIGDGMGVSHIDAARLRYYGAGGSLNMEKLPVFGQVQTYAVEQGTQKPELVTDSASSATAWSSGVKTYNAALGKDTNGVIVQTVMEEAKTLGMRTGNVSTAEITDATPAAMFSHVSLRSCQGPDFVAAACQVAGHGVDLPVAEQIASNGVADVIFGGGMSRFEPEDEALMKANGYKVLGSFGDPAVATQTAATQKIATRTDLQSVSGKDQKVIGLFNRGNMTIEKAKREQPGSVQAAEPSLPEMTTKAIDLLSASKDGRRNGFFLQVEGALIDKRSHANDASQALEEMQAFDNAIAVAVAFAERDGNTLVIVTADHECAGFGVVGKGTYTNAEALTPPANVDAGNTANNSSPSRATNGAKDPLRSSGIINGSGAADPKNFGVGTFRTPDDPPEVVDGSPEASLWLAYLSGNHTGADVNLYAAGPGSAKFTGRHNNIDLYVLMKASLRAFR
jgi:alkaline phosphatase